MLLRMDESLDNPPIGFGVLDGLAGLHHRTALVPRIGCSWGQNVEQSTYPDRPKPAALLAAAKFTPVYASAGPRLITGYLAHALGARAMFA